MKVLVAYASKYGATKEIAEHIAAQIAAAGHETDTQPVAHADTPDQYDAVVVGGAAYIGHWQKEAAEYVRHHHAALAARPVWLFSSGPLGTQRVDQHGRDAREAATPPEFEDFDAEIHPRDRHVFFGKLDPSKLGLRDRIIRAMPAGRALMPEGDFRDWNDIDAWAATIVEALAREAGTHA